MAYADNEVTEDERAEMHRILKEFANLKDSEVEFIMEMSMMQKRAQVELSSDSPQQGFDGERKQLLVSALYAIAEADGRVSEEELQEIHAITTEFGLE